MTRVAAVLLLVFVGLLLLRALRLFVERWLQRLVSSRRPAPEVGEAARDPICGAWFDRRLAVAGRRGAEVVEVCSEGCRRRLEAG